MAGPRERGTKVPKAFARIFGGLHAGVYRLTRGRIGGSMQGGDIVVLRTTGARSGKARTSPLIAVEHGDGWAVVASFSGHDQHPGWYHNLLADPSAELQIGGETHAVTARVLDGAERDELWGRVVSVYDDYAKYQRVTDRVIPLVALEPA